MSYPDLLEEDGEYYLFETQKDFARVHQFDRSLVEGLWGQFEDGAEVSRDGCLLEPNDPSGAIDLPPLPEFTRRDRVRADHGVIDLKAGFTVEMWLELRDLAAGQTPLDSRSANGQGLCLQTTARGTVEIASTTAEPRTAGTATRGCGLENAITSSPSSTVGRRSSPSSSTVCSATAARSDSSAGAASTRTCGT